MAQLVDWELAGRIAGTGLGEGPAAMPDAPDLASAGERSAAAVLQYTGLSVDEVLPEPEWVTRRQWQEMNLNSMRELLDPLARRIEGSSTGIATGPIGAVTSRVLAVEVGALLGFASRHVLGQYEFPLLGGPRDPRLVFVGENLGNAAGQLGGDPEQVLDWVALHEVTHAVHFASAPWLRTYIGGLARTLLTESPVRLGVGDIITRARRTAFSDPRRVLAELRGSDPLSLLAPADSLATINSMQSAMAAIEGYAEHVMDAAAGELGPAVATLRAGIERRRENRSPAARLLSCLFGFELKLRQYKDGKRFCDEVVVGVGIDGLNQAWRGSGALPDLAELAEPGIWIDRVAIASTAA